MKEKRSEEWLRFLKYYWPLAVYGGVGYWTNDFIVEHMDKSEEFMSTVWSIVWYGSFLVIMWLCALAHDEDKKRAEKTKIDEEQSEKKPKSSFSQIQKSTQDERSNTELKQNNIQSKQQISDLDTEQVRIGYRVENFNGTIEAMAWELLPHTTDVRFKSNTEDKFNERILGKNWIIAGWAAKKRGLQHFNLETEVKFQIIAKALAKAYCHDYNEVISILRETISIKSDEFIEGTKEGEQIVESKA